jgi:glutamyl aminopeptidase
MNADTMNLFKILTEFPAAPGFERELRKWVQQEMLKWTPEVIQDRIGSIFGVLRGNEQGPRIMVAGHLDEVGFLVTGITEQGFLRFQPLGGWFQQVLLAQRVQVMTEKGPIIGVIGSTPPHLLDESQRNKLIEYKQMTIDVGADDYADALHMGIQIGQPVLPICPFTPLANPKKIMAKAWDNRYGVGLALELIQSLKTKHPTHPNIVFAGATVQEEVGLRGARTAASLIEPDLFYALDASPANDTAGDRHAFGRLGKGALLRIYDPSMITHRGMIEFILDIAHTYQIPYQTFISSGGTDAGSVHLHGKGVPSAVIGVCARYIHSSCSILHTDDYAAAKELLIQLVLHSNQTTVNTILSRA